MELERDLWLVGPYYVDIDQNGQLRIVGPNNHLYFGAVGLFNNQIKVISVNQKDGEISLELEVTLPNSFLPDPAMGHIRLVRSLTQIFGRQEPTFEEVEKKHPGKLVAQSIVSGNEGKQASVTYLRSYGDHYYGTKVTFPIAVTLERKPNGKGFVVTSQQPIRLKLTTITDTLPRPYTGEILQHSKPDFSLLPDDQAVFGAELMQRSALEIDHLVRHDKTSGYDYGTVFPRDWMEAADLGSEDFTPAGLLHLYVKSLKHVNELGAGWHEDVIGEYEAERKIELDQLAREFQALISTDHPFTPEFHSALRQLDELFVTRLMIDIEPHYLLGLRLVPFEDFDISSQNKLKHVAQFVLKRAQEVDLVTFNRVALPFRRTKEEEYYSAGNWRDSTLAFKHIHPIIAPYDVNAVLYPQALRVIAENAQQLCIGDQDISMLIRKWDRVKDWYRYSNKDGTEAFALALYDIRQGSEALSFSQLKVNHIDEAYDLFYGEPSENEVLSFAKRLVDPAYFYTASGPTLVGSNDGYDHSQYHGKVIWIKQTAYVIAGLERQLLRGRKECWEDLTLHCISDALSQTALASLNAFTKLKEFPELYFDDEGKPRLYTDQPTPEGQMNTVQLWSAVGARRILRVYLRHVAQ